MYVCVVVGTSGYLLVYLCVLLILVNIFVYLFILDTVKVFLGSFVHVCVVIDTNGCMCMCVKLLILMVVCVCV